MNRSMELVDAWLEASDASAERHLAALLDVLEGEVAEQTEAWAREHLRELPTPLRREADAALARRRERIERLAAEIAARRGAPDELLEHHWCVFTRGGNPVPYLDLLLREGKRDEAAAIARLALAKGDCAAPADLETIIERAARPPGRWAEVVADFARAPSMEGWESLMEFTPTEVFYQRIRYTVQLLVRLGVDPNFVFQYAARWGTIPDAIELVERGLVDPETVIARGDRGPARARGLWLGLAAQAALARGDRFRAVRLLREAYDVASPDFTPDFATMDIREQADAEFHELLDRAGIPRV